MNLVLGTGNFGILIYEILSSHNYNIEGFVDLNPESSLREFIELPVLKKNDLGPNDVLFIASNRYNHEWILREYKDYQVKFADSLVDFSTLNLDEYAKSRFLKWSSEKAVDVLEDYKLIRSSNTLESSCNHEIMTLSSLDIVVTERCTLKCKDCSNLMQYYTKPKNSDTQEILAAITKILLNVRVKAIRLIGGEPLISKDLPDIIDFIHNNFNYQYDAIQIYTNDY